MIFQHMGLSRCKPTEKVDEGDLVGGDLVRGRRAL